MLIKLRLLALLSGLIIIGMSGTARADVEVIALKYRNAEQLLPMLRPLVEPGGAVSGMQNQIILRASRRNIEELRRVVASIDTQPRRLMISVRQDTAENVQGGAAGVAGTINSRGGGEIRGQVFDSRNVSDERISQRLQVLEGYPATINVGQSVPVPSRSVTGGVTGANQGFLIAETVTYRDIGTGFEVVPRVSGDMVQLEISPRRETPGNAGPGSVNSQRITTTASGRLGEWFELGGASQQESRQNSGLTYGSSGERRDIRRVWVRVEEIK
jgi:type II secretory pathway component GspD/PulD (secretin)